MIPWFLFHICLVSAGMLPDAADLAAKADLGIILAFLSDFGLDKDVYDSFLEEHHLTFPQSLMNFYGSIHTKQFDEITEELSTNFPFSDFGTFVTAFPWYSELVQEVSAGGYYLPQQITSSDSLVTSILSADLALSTISVSLGIVAKTAAGPRTSSKPANSSLVNAANDIITSVVGLNLFLVFCVLL